MPVRIFWLLLSQIDRIHAQADLRAMRIMSAAQSQEGAQSVIDDLREEMGKVGYSDPVVNNKLDREGLASLKMLSGALGR